MARELPSLKGDRVAIDVDADSRRDAKSGDIVDRFEVQQLLGEGGMGSVFVAQDRGLGRVVALKRLKDGLEKDQSVLRRFVLEAQIGAQLEHPNIVPLYSFEHSEAGSPAIAMQLLEGRTMTDYINAAAAAPRSARAVKGEYSLKERIGTLLGVGEAIHFAHERGVIHRDLKPENVMLGRYREVYVMDWGVARVVGSQIDMARDRRNGDVPVLEVPDAPEAEVIGSLPTVVTPHARNRSGDPATATQQGQVMGTPQYMPPEQALGQIDRLGPPADQYALGVILQELATLRPARSHTEMMVALTQALQNQLEPAIDVDGHALHPALAAIIARATQQNPSDRYPTVRAMTEDLRSFTRDEAVSVYPEGLARRFMRAAARRPVLAFTILSLCGFSTSVAVVAGVIVQAQRKEQHAQELENVRRVLVAVSTRSHDVEVELRELAADAKAIASATIEVLEDDARGLNRKPRVLPPLEPHDSYGGAPVSFDGTVVTWPGQKPGDKLPVNAAKLAGVERWLRECVVDALPKVDRTSNWTAQNAALKAGRSLLLRAFVGLEDGSFTQFPAREVTADPRGRPWYVMASRDPVLRWTRPVVDATKRTLRISAVLGLHSKGGFLGVAGCDMRVSLLAPKLKLDIPGFRRAYLVDEDGYIVVADGLEAAMLAKVKNPDDELDLPPVDDPALAQRLKGKERGGYLESGDRLLVYSKLVSPAWTYVAELDKATYGRR